MRKVKVKKERERKIRNINDLFRKREETEIEGMTNGNS